MAIQGVVGVVSEVLMAAGPILVVRKECVPALIGPGPERATGQRLASRGGGGNGVKRLDAGADNAGECGATYEAPSLLSRDRVS